MTFDTIISYKITKKNKKKQLNKCAFTVHLIPYILTINAFHKV